MYRRKLDAHDMFVLRGIYNHNSMLEIGKQLIKPASFVKYRIGCLMREGFVSPPPIKGQARNYSLTDAGLEILRANTGNREGSREKL
jgi:hypothetical protein